MAVVGINLLYLIPGVSGGTETYAAELLRGLGEIKTENSYRIYVNLESRDWPIPEGSKFVKVVCDVNAKRRERRYLYEQTVLARRARKDKVELLHSLGYMCPLFCSMPSAVTIHDVNCVALGRYMPLARRILLFTMLRMSAIQCRRIVTISAFSKDEIVRYLKVNPSKITVIHAAGMSIENEDKSTHPKVGADYVVLFSSPSAHKNVPRAIQAYKEAKGKYKIKQRLVIVGTLPDGFVIGDRSDIQATGYVTKQEMVRILAGADFLINPSLYEGFGLPILDAMGLGTPVVCSRRASFPEVAGDAAEFFDPESVPDIAEKLAIVANDSELRIKMRQKGFENAKRFSWKKTARLTEQVYLDLLSRTSGVKDNS